ncbi:MAG: hypothetical protein V1891_01910 [bacterium]
MDYHKFKAICLYSGGLDSILAIQIIRDAAKGEVEIIPIRFITPFFDYKNEEEIKKETAYLKAKFNITLKNIDLTAKYIKLLYSPKYGFGKNLNPCIDCKILMIKTAKKIMEKENANFIFTGEVVGQRPKSQMKNKLFLIEREAKLDGYLLRPLSAKLLDKTIPEKTGIVDRKKLYDINGRSRSVQLKLAEKYNIEYFATPSGGCLLTDFEYARKLKIIKEKIKLTEHLLKFLKWGRIFMVKNKILIIGRNDLENKKLLKLASYNDLLIQPKEIPGPLCVLINNQKASGRLPHQKILKILCSICAKYSFKKNFNIKSIVKIQFGKKNSTMDNIENLKGLLLKEATEIDVIIDKEKETESKENEMEKKLGIFKI